MLRSIRPLIGITALLIAAQAGTSTFTVRKGDTLSTISRQVGVPVPDLVRANAIRNPDRIVAGQVLRVPSGATASAGRSSPFAGLGTWVDVYDFSPEFQLGGRRPALTPTAIDRMATNGVRTLYLQGAVASGRGGTTLIDPPLLAAFLTRAHARGMRVVAWYLPSLQSVAADLQRLAALRDFRAGGQHFDGLAVDIEATTPSAAARSRAIVDLSRTLRASTRLPLGAIVLPPTFLESVSPNFWPGFPWAGLSRSYDAWLPMTYWTMRARTSPYRDATRYISDTVRRLRARVGSRAAVHPIGGLGTADLASYAAFVRVSKSLGVTGWSMYDFATTPASAWRVLRQ